LPLLENTFFQIDNELKTEYFLRFRSIEKDGRINMTFEIVMDRLTFWLDRTNEIPEWSFEFINKRKDEVERELKLLFESQILVEYRGNRTRIILQDENGTELRRYSYYKGIALNWNVSRIKKTYNPFFEK